MLNLLTSILLFVYFSIGSFSHAEDNPSFRENEKLFLKNYQNIFDKSLIKYEISKEPLEKLGIALQIDSLSKIDGIRYSEGFESQKKEIGKLVSQVKSEVASFRSSLKKSEVELITSDFPDSSFRLIGDLPFLSFNIPDLITRSKSDNVDGRLNNLDLCNNEEFKKLEESSEFVNLDFSKLMEIQVLFSLNEDPYFQKYYTNAAKIAEKKHLLFAAQLFRLRSKKPATKRDVEKIGIGRSRLIAAGIKEEYLNNYIEKLRKISPSCVGVVSFNALNRIRNQVELNS